MPRPRRLPRHAEEQWTIELLPRAECLDCEWSIGPHASSTERGKRHVEDRGHEVRVVTEQAVYYRPVTEEKP